MWLYVPETSSASAPASEDLISATDWQFRTLEQSAMWRSKPTAAKSWYRAWRTVPWMKRLFGRILKPSMANRGVELWIRSLADIRASHSVSPEGEKEPMIPDTFGLKWQDLYVRYSPPNVFSKTSEGNSQWDLNRSEQNWHTWITKLRRGCLQRQRLVPAINENGCLFWPTPNAEDADGTGVVQLRRIR